MSRENPRPPIITAWGLPSTPHLLRSFGLRGSTHGEPRFRLVPAFWSAMLASSTLGRTQTVNSAQNSDEREHRVTTTVHEAAAGHRMLAAAVHWQCQLQQCGTCQPWQCQTPASRIPRVPRIPQIPTTGKARCESGRQCFTGIRLERSEK